MNKRIMLGCMRISSLTIEEVERLVLTAVDAIEAHTC